MAHEIDELMEGVYAYLGAVTDPWHKLGTTLESTFTAEQAMTVAHLGGWDVRKTPLTTLTDDGVLEVDDHFATVRTNPLTGAVNVLGVVGSQYAPIQNEENCTLLDTLVDESGAHFQTAGALRGGRETFISLKLPEQMTVGDDDLDLYIAALNSHDGSSAFRFIISPVRIVCANTQAAAINRAKASFSIRHTAGATAQIAEARDALGLTWRYLDAFQAEADAMIATAMGDSQMKVLTENLMGVHDAPTKLAADRRKEAAASIRTIYRSSDTNESVRGTAWGGYQAVVEYIDHDMPVRGKDHEKSTRRALRTATSGSIRQLKEGAFDAFHSLVGA